MRTKYINFGLIFILGFSSFSGNFLSSDIARRIKKLQFFISAEELFEECERNSPPEIYSGKKLPHGRWFYSGGVGKISFGEVRYLKGIRFDPPLEVVMKKSSGFFKHLIASILNEYWLKMGKIDARNVPYVLSYYNEFGYFYEYRPAGELGEDSPNGTPIMHRLREAGMDMWDVTDPDDACIGKHYIFGPEFDPKTHRDGWLVDYEALHINHNRFQEFLHKNAQEMKKVLGYKFELLMVAYNLLRFFDPSPEEKTQFQERFVELFSEYQKEIWKRILRERGIVP